VVIKRYQWQIQGAVERGYGHSLLPSTKDARHLVGFPSILAVYRCGAKQPGRRLQKTVKRVEKTRQKEGGLRYG